jgi:hypothetical protein
LIAGGGKRRGCLLVYIGRRRQRWARHVGVLF